MEGINNLLDSDLNTSDILELVIKTTIAFTFALFLARLGQIRFLKKSAAFDAILYFMLGALMVAGITSNNNFYGILLSGFVIIFLHWLFALISYYSSNLGYFFKGKSHILMKDGEFILDQMKKYQITEHDLEGALRLKLNTDSFKNVKRAYLERNGDISFVIK